MKIYDASHLAELVNTYPIIGKIINQYSYIPESDRVKLNQREKNLFELFVKGEKASDIKKNFTKSIILSYLYEHKSSTLKQIKEGLNTDFSNSVSENFLVLLLEELSHSEFIIHTKDKPRIYRITELGESKFQEAEVNSNRQKKAFVFEVDKYLSEQNLGNIIQSVVDDILELYSSSYQMTREDIQEREPQRKRLSKIYKNLKQRIEANIGESKKTEKIILELLSICQRNDFLNNINMSMLFMDLYKSNMLDEYMKQSPLIIYLDTQLLLQIICLACKEEGNENDFLYKSVQSLMEAIHNSSFKIELRTSMDYVEEAFYHIVEGVKLDRFLSLSYIKEIGSSKNVIFNYYLYLKENNVIDNALSFGEFIEDKLGICIDTTEKEIMDESILQLSDIFEGLNIQCNTPPIFEDFEKYKVEYENVLSYSKSMKTYRARISDVRMFLMLSMREHYIDEFDERITPIFVTWDSSFYGMCKTFFSKYKELNRWLLYAPTILANKIDIMNLNINSHAVTYNIITLSETNFALSNDSISLFDMLNSMFPGGGVNLKLAKEIALLRKGEREQTRKEDFERETNNLPIDIVFMNLIKFYQSSESNYNSNDLIKVFQLDENIPRIVTILKSSIEDYQEGREINNLYSGFNNLIKQIKNEA